MARDAADSCRDVGAVVEVGVIGKLVHANPAHRPAARGTFANRCELRAVPHHELMAIHAGLRGRNVRDGRNFDRGVTIPAVEAELTNVEAVAVLDRLVGTVAHVCVPRGKVVPDARDRERRNDDAHEGGHDRELIPPRGEDLGQGQGLRSAGGQLQEIVAAAAEIPVNEIPAKLTSRYYSQTQKRVKRGPPRPRSRSSGYLAITTGRITPSHAIHRKPPPPPRSFGQSPRHRARWRGMPPQTATERSKRRARASRGGSARSVMCRSASRTPSRRPARRRRRTRT